MSGRRKGHPLWSWVALLAALAAAPSCDAVSGVDNDERWEKERRRSELRARFRPKIPISERVGCDVCPVECANFDLSEIPLLELFRRFRRAAAVWAAIPNPGPTGPEWDEIARLTCILKRRGEEWKHMLTSLHLDDREEVRFCAAWMVWQHGVRSEEGMQVMREIRDRRPPAPFASWAWGFVWAWNWRLDNERKQREKDSRWRNTPQ